MKPFLVISRVGKNSLHKNWIACADARTFDVLLSAYDPDVVVSNGNGIFFEFRPGFKVSGYSEIFKHWAVTLKNYEYIALFDDDIDTDTLTINALFDLAKENNIKLCQPALSWDSHFTYGASLRQPGLKLRWVSQIEMMCPIFRLDHIQRCAGLFDLGFESGIDLIWCNLDGVAPRSFAVIDAYPVTHTRPIGKEKNLNGFTDGRVNEDAIHQVLKLFQINWLPWRVYSAQTMSCRDIDADSVLGKFEIIARALATLVAVPKQTGSRSRARAILVYIKHLIEGKAFNCHALVQETSGDRASPSR